MNASISTPTQVKTHGLAIASLVLAFLGFTFLPWVGSIFAIVTGNIARKEIRAYPEQYSGENMAKAAVTLGWIGTLGIFVVAVMLVLFLAPVHSVGPVFIP